MKLEKDEGFFLGAMSLNYGATVTFYHAPIALLWYTGLLGGKTAVAAAGIGAVVLPLLLYRSSRSWQLMVYYLLLPGQLPANRQADTAAGDNSA